MLSALFTFLSGVTNLYCLICVIAVFMTWIPGVKFTAFGKFISAITDPYLNLFSKIKFLKIANIDFSPMIGIGLMSLFSSILAKIAQTGRIYFGGILAAIIYMIWNLLSTFAAIFIILILIRWIVLFVNHNQTPYNSAWNQIDVILEKISWKFSKIFVKKPIKYITSLLITWIGGSIFLILGSLLINQLIILCYSIPF